MVRKREIQIPLTSDYLVKLACNSGHTFNIL